MAVNTTVEVVMPPMGDSVSEGSILEWHKQEGDEMSEDEILVERVVPASVNDADAVLLGLWRQSPNPGQVLRSHHLALVLDAAGSAVGARASLVVCEVVVMVSEQREYSALLEAFTAFVDLAVIPGNVAQADDLAHAHGVELPKNRLERNMVAVNIGDYSEHRVTWSSM